MKIVKNITKRTYTAKEKFGNIKKGHVIKEVKMRNGKPDSIIQYEIEYY